MTPRIRVAALAVAAALVVAACGDDANDDALRAQQLADRLAEERSPSTAEPAGEQPAEVATGSTTVPPTTVARTGVVIAVTALDNSFRPMSVEAKVGDEVVWENRGRNEHDVLSIEGTLDDGSAWGVTVEEFQPGAIFAHVFTEPGEYRYYCTIHGTTDVGMIGTVVVTD